MKQKIYIAALLAGMLALAGCGGGSSSTVQQDPPTDPDKEKISELEDENKELKEDLEKAQDDLAKEQGKDAETMAKKLHAAIGTPAPSTITFDGTKVEQGTDDLAKTTDSVSANNGWTGGYFKKDKKEARVYWRANAKGEGMKFSTEFPTDFSARTEDPGVTGVAAGSVLSFDFSGAAPTDRIVIPSITGTSGRHAFKAADLIRGGFTIQGSYYGVSGKYDCTGTVSTCFITKHADEKRALTGTWTFTPTSADSKVTDPKNVYAYYGWWLDTGATGDKYQVNVFSGTTGTAAADADARRFSEVAATTGTATYEGGAAGKYAIYSEVPKAHESGHFTANAKLTADFDATVNTLKGTIDKFMVDGKEKAGWSISLTSTESDGSDGTQNISASTNYDGITAIAEWKIGDNDPESGTWGNVHFHDVGDDQVPNHVTGQFDITNNRAEIIGAFGATK
ncbi:MAG: hypothetical protein OXE41_03250 [Gammaproteobacteria bacterium]|nr:hypothetical protein [Gammaproteobacteria bacterium]